MIDWGYILSEIFNYLCMQCILTWILQNIKMTLCCRPLGHQMPLQGGSSYLKFLTIYVYNAFSLAFSRMSRWPYFVGLLATRCLYGGYILSEIFNYLCIPCFLQNVKMTLHCTLLGHKMPLQGGTSDWNCEITVFPGQLVWWVQVIWKSQNVKMTLHSTALGHQMPLCYTYAV